MTRTLRPYQAEARDAVRDEWGSGKMRTAVVLPTGAGKTDVIAALAVAEAQAGGRVLLLAHRGELLDQMRDRCVMHGMRPRDIGRVQANQDDRGRPITVAMTQTLRSPARRARIRKRPTLIGLDECHRAVSPSNMDILAWGGAFDGTPTFGVTATLVRGDDRGLGDVWESVAFARDIGWGVAEGHLVPPRGKAVVIDAVDLERAKVRQGDYTDAELGDMIEQGAEDIVSAWVEHGGNRITASFTPTIDAATELHRAFDARGIPAGLVLGSTPPPERDRLYADLAAGRIRVLVGVMVTTEGWDCPPVSCILMARPTRLPGLFTQMIGRGLRPWPGKDDCLILDVVGASRRQKLCTLVDISPSAEYDDSELPLPPCSRHDLPMPCPVCTAAELEDELWEDDGAGGRRPRRRLDGPARYDDVDLFGRSGFVWLFTHGGRRFVPIGDQLVTIWPNDDGETYDAGWCNAKGLRTGEWFAEDVSLEDAKAAAEAYALRRDPEYVSRDARWRGLKTPRKGDRYWAQYMDLDIPKGATAGFVADQIAIARASRRLDRVG